jgi:hypothetical protein
MSRAGGVIAVAALAVAVGCGSEPVTLELNFPSQETFLYSEQAEVLAFPVGASGLGECPRLLAEVSAGSPSETAAVETGAQPVCRFRSGGVTVDSVEEGPHAWVAVVEDGANTPLLRGCTIAEVYADAPRIVIHLFMTDEYRTAATAPLACASVEDKCASGCF